MPSALAAKDRCNLLIVAAFTGCQPEAMNGSQVLCIGKAEVNARVQAAVEAVGAKYIFVEAK